jgi:hypothetical protein
VAAGGAETALTRWKPIDSLSALTREELRLRLTCSECGHTAEPDIDELRHQVKLRGGFWSKLTDLPTYLRCGECGSKTFRHEIIPRSAQTQR